MYPSEFKWIKHLQWFCPLHYCSSFQVYLKFWLYVYRKCKTSNGEEAPVTDNIRFRLCEANALRSLWLDAILRFAQCFEKTISTRTGDLDNWKYWIVAFFKKGKENSAQHDFSLWEDQSANYWQENLFHELSLWTSEFLATMGPESTLSNYQPRKMQREHV